jgi:two-component system chemotaxis response regulator CheY
MGEIFEGIEFFDFAVNGQETIELVKLSIEEDRNYGLVCLDIMMPEIDGTQALKEIRQFEKDKGINPENNYDYGKVRC